MKEIRQKAIECAKAFRAICKCKEYDIDEGYNITCYCEYNEVADIDCGAVYGYEHGVEEGKQKALAEIAKNLEQEIANLNRAELTEQNLACFVFRIKEIIGLMKGEQA